MSIFRILKSYIKVIHLKQLNLYQLQALTERWLKLSEVKCSEQLPEVETFFLETSLYRSFPILDTGTTDIESFNGTIRTYCIECNNTSVFSRSRPTGGNSPGPKRAFNPGSLEPEPRAGYIDDGTKMRQASPAEIEAYFKEQRREKLKVENKVFTVELRCAVNPEHRMVFCFRVYQGNISKIGQDPSLADLAAGDLKKYRKILGDKYPEFSRAIGLFANGIGIGAFTYLRRIFEDLLEQAHQKAAKQNGWDERVYKNSRWDEKIDLLSSELPDFLVQNKRLYSILSLGIHELDEDTCKQNFPLVRTSIELILDEKIERAEKEAKIEAVRKSIQNFRHT